MRKLNIIKVSMQRKPQMYDIVAYKNRSSKFPYYKTMVVSVKGNLVTTINDKGEHNHFLWRTSEGGVDHWFILDPNKEKDFRNRCIDKMKFE
jgi:hypothetical protein